MSCTCSNSFLFLTTNKYGSNIFQFDLLSSFRLIKQWNPLESCESNVLIQNLAYNNRMPIWLSTKDRTSFTNNVQLSLFPSSKRYKRSWTNNSRLFAQVWRVVKLEHKYQSKAHNAVLFGSNILTIRTEKCLDFYAV